MVAAVEALVGDHMNVKASVKRAIRQLTVKKAFVHRDCGDIVAASVQIGLEGIEIMSLVIRLNRDEGYNPTAYQSLFIKNRPPHRINVTKTSSPTN